MPNNTVSSYDVAIIGAGPAGCAAALGLGSSGLKVALIDKAAYPRSKTCGDAIPGPAIKALSNALPFFEKEFGKLKDKQHISCSRIIMKRGRSIDYHWILPAYNIKRDIFDNFLLKLVKQYTSTDILSGWPVSNILAGAPHLIKSDIAAEPITAKFIIGCDGANSIVINSTQHPAHKFSPQVFAVRSYFEGLDLNPNTNSFFIEKKYMPGYFWAFPLPDGVFNVGFGMKADKHGKVSINMKKVLEEFIQSERMKPAFANSLQLSEISGSLIPIGGHKGIYSGDGYLLAGDAARLADPLQGHGIDKAIVSGLLAAHHSMKCFREEKFDAGFNEYYDLSIKNGIEKELRKNRQRQMVIANFPFLINIYARFKK